jgi:hypothetical protein
MPLFIHMTISIQRLWGLGECLCLDSLHVVILHLSSLCGCHSIGRRQHFRGFRAKGHTFTLVGSTKRIPKGTKGGASSCGCFCGSRGTWCTFMWFWFVDLFWRIPKGINVGTCSCGDLEVHLLGLLIVDYTRSIFGGDTKTLNLVGEKNQTVSDSIHM